MWGLYKKSLKVSVTHRFSLLMKSLMVHYLNFWMNLHQHLQRYLEHTITALNPYYCNSDILHLYLLQKKAQVFQTHALIFCIYNHTLAYPNLPIIPPTKNPTNVGLDWIYIEVIFYYISYFSLIFLMTPATYRSSIFWAPCFESIFQLVSCISSYNK